MCGRPGTATVRATARRWRSTRLTERPSSAATQATSARRAVDGGLEDVPGAEVDAPPGVADEVGAPDDPSRAGEHPPSATSPRTRTGTTTIFRMDSIVGHGVA